MRLKIYQAASMKEAIARVRAELGPDALILSERRNAQGVEVTAGLEVAEEEPVRPVSRQTERRPVAPLPETDFSFHGIPPNLAARLAGPDLCDSLGSALSFGKLPLGAGTRILLAGLPGAGKTLTIARLATRLVLAGEKPLVITADGRRAGAAEELAAYTRLLGLSLMVASTPAMLTRALASPAARNQSTVLIDSSGINPFAAGEVAGLVALMQAADAVPVLVMAAGQDPGEAAEQAACFAPLGIRHLLPTRLDLARRLGSVIGVAATSRLILTEASIGSGVTDGLVEITPAFLADRLRIGAAVATVPAPARPRTPIFPSARAHAAESWSNERHG